MFRSIAPDTVISMQVVVSSRLLKYETRCSRGSADGRPESPDLDGMTLQAEYTDHRSQSCRSRRVLALTARCWVIRFEYLSPWSLSGLNLESGRVTECAHADAKSQNELPLDVFLQLIKYHVVNFSHVLSDLICVLKHILWQAA